MTTPRPDSGRPRVLVPVRVLEGEAIGQGVLDLLAPADVVLLGYHVIPEQTAPGQARLSFEERAQSALSELAEAFETAGATVDSVLVFTHDREQTIERVATEEACDAIVRLNPAMADETLGVVLYGDVRAARVGRFAASLVAGRPIDVTVVELTAPGTESSLLDLALDALGTGGVPAERITVDRRETETPVRTIADVAAEFDAIVLGERTPTLGDLLLGEFDERVATESLGVVLVVRGPPNDHDKT